MDKPMGLPSGYGTLASSLTHMWALESSVGKGFPSTLSSAQDLHRDDDYTGPRVYWRMCIQV